ncbi:MAG: S-adenosylmethionine:tRNA ribosyltransferase-isomerase, partial [Gammaproteobacteria bacterium]|nr:S-adenosylmethionine:tRNA ribosyltransferase-isomerase [Gammaproteobacteria bacterium]
MRISDFDYELPHELIARYPPTERRGSRLLEVSAGLRDRQFAELSALLRPNDLLVFNDSRVIPARLHGQKESGGRIELLIERVESDCVALAHLRASKPPKPGSRIIFDDVNARVLGRAGALYRLEFATSIWALLERSGEVPLPPYLERDAEPGDRERYQTIYARDPGAVAAPTAGLHFDKAMLA